MRIVATADTHFEFDADRVPEGDVFIHAGDLMYTGYPDEWYARVQSLSRLPHKHKLLIPGNHDFHIQNYEGVAAAELRRVGVRLLGLKNPIANIGGVKILGMPWVVGLPGWAFNRDETDILAYMNELIEPCDIIVSHQPMYNHLDACRPEQPEYRNQEHVGCMAYNRWFHRDNYHWRPKLWINGHIHESYGREMHMGTEFANVAMCNREYEQANEPMVFDL